MGTFSAWHILIVTAVILLLFGGGGKISDLMGDVGKGIKAFRAGLAQPNESASTRVAIPEPGRDMIDTMNRESDLGTKISPAGPIAHTRAAQEFAK